MFPDFFFTVYFIFKAATPGWVFCEYLSVNQPYYLYKTTIQAPCQNTWVFHTINGGKPNYCKGKSHQSFYIWLDSAIIQSCLRLLII
jgi:hypothetical protein